MAAFSWAPSVVTEQRSHAHAGRPRTCPRLPMRHGRSPRANLSKFSCGTVALGARAEYTAVALPRGGRRCTAVMWLGNTLPVRAAFEATASHGRGGPMQLRPWIRTRG